ncbi:uncharacterized protein LOC112904566 [Agrilus planipennis]|uniref:Uncharacterized protein LOC112904566 n=1 Tax=Agrilus planipennis TaxID=224129 RepID=A0A7F5R475_AGRPL|nr:uncharacterized protein LOC112904566 [Agrilus planipennis]
MGTDAGKWRKSVRRTGSFGSMTGSSLIFLLKLAWESGKRIPLLLAIGLVILADVRRQQRGQRNINRMRRVLERRNRLQEQRQRDSGSADFSWQSAADPDASTESNSYIWR